MFTKDDVLKKVQSGELTIEDVKRDGLLCSVTKRIDYVKQPRGGYVHPKLFDVIQLDGGGVEQLHVHENISPGLIGLAVDYLTRHLSGSSVDSGMFDVTYQGAKNVGEISFFKILVNDFVCHDISDLDDNKTVVAAIRLSGFDVAYRNNPIFYKPVIQLRPDLATIENVRIMVKRALHFLALYGPKIADSLTFDGGYTGYVSSGDGDFMTSDTLWDFKVSNKAPTSKHTLQLLMYWRMGLQAVDSMYYKNYRTVRYLGIYNPRLNLVYRLGVDKISVDVINIIDHDIIGY